MRPLLTSGYLSNFLAGGENSKLPGKCSIGGYRDSTTTSFATGGINKDSTCEEWSPHFDMHADAAQVAQQATIDLLLDIRNEVNDDTLFLPFLGLSTPPTVSIALVIDTTAVGFDFIPLITSVADEIQQFISSRFEGGLTVNYILVPFNDTGVGEVQSTKNASQLGSFVQSLDFVSGASPVPSVSALVRAAGASEVGSPIFMFADKEASDSDLLNDALSLASLRNLRVYTVFLEPGEISKRSVSNVEQVLSRGKRQTDPTEVYREIVADTSGQIFLVEPSGVAGISSLIAFAALPTRRTIFRQADTVMGRVTVNFQVDKATTRIMLSVTGFDFSKLHDTRWY